MAGNFIDRHPGFENGIPLDVPAGAGTFSASFFRQAVSFDEMIANRKVSRRVVEARDL
jgi:hypothetical protein